MPGLGRAELLLERDGELASLRATLAEAAAGEGRLALVEGPAGIGKTRLLAELRQAAEEEGFRLLSARGSELEREFPFGVVRQLLEPAVADEDVRARWLADAASSAESIFGAADPDSPAVLTDASFAALHGLYWLTANAAADGPLILSVDDLHWCDRPSLRFLAYLARRLEDMPAAVGTTLRSTDPGTDPALIAEITGARALEENVRSELYATGARPRTTALSGVESLTERELRVATLAAGGQTNRDIAQALYVTPKTVEVHLSNAYRKLDISSRRDLPAALTPSTPLT